jgi:hypothetical protein
LRDIRGDLQDRVNMVEQQINAEHAQFKTLIAQLKREQDSRSEDLKSQLQAVNRLIEVAAWQHNVRAAVALAAAVAAAVEVSAAAAARQFSHPQN